MGWGNDTREALEKSWADNEQLRQRAEQAEAERDRYARALEEANMVMNDLHSAMPPDGSRFVELPPHFVTCYRIVEAVEAEAREKGIIGRNGRANELEDME